MHLVLCPGCGYSFWTTESLETIQSWDPHCIKDDGYDWVQTGPNTKKSKEPQARETTWWPWLADGDAIDFIAMPELYSKATW